MKRRVTVIALMICAIFTISSAFSFYSGDMEAAAATKVAQVKNLHQTSATTTSITLKWNKVSKAKGYKVYKSTNNGKTWKLVKTTSKTTYKSKNLKPCLTYKYKVKAYKIKNKKKVYGKYSKKLDAYTNSKYGNPNYREYAGVPNYGWWEGIEATSHKVGEGFAYNYTKYSQATAKADIKHYGTVLKSKGYSIDDGDFWVYQEDFGGYSSAWQKGLKYVLVVYSPTDKVVVVYSDTLSE